MLKNVLQYQTKNNFKQSLTMSYNIKQCQKMLYNVEHSQTKCTMSNIVKQSQTMYDNVEQSRTMIQDLPYSMTNACNNRLSCKNSEIAKFDFDISCLSQKQRLFYLNFMAKRMINLTSIILIPLFELIPLF